MNVEKSPDAFRTISEVAESLDLPQHVLRFWETKFSQIKPMKRGGGRRYYRPDDVVLLQGIRILLYEEGYTIKGVQKILKKQGVREFLTSLHEKSNDSSTKSETTLASEEEELTNVFDRSEKHEIATETELSNTNSETEQVQNNQLNQQESSEPPESEHKHLPKDVLTGSTESSSDDRPKLNLLGRLRSDGKSNQPNQESEEKFSKKEIKLLQDTMFELLECKRILDNSR